MTARAKIIDGRQQAADLRQHIAAATTQLKQKHNLTPGLAVILVGDDPASHVYVRNKEIAITQAGMKSFPFFLPADITPAVLLERVQKLNHDSEVHGILIQLPLPKQINQQQMIEAIHPAKDVDGLHPFNAGQLAAGQPGFIPCTPLGCLLLAKRSLGDLSGLHAVVLGRSVLVGKPLAQLLLRANATVTLAHSYSRDLPGLCRQADILCAAVGRAEMVKGDWIKPGACVIDIGINRVLRPAAAKTTGKADAQNKAATQLVGDVAMDEAAQKAAYITPVPGGVGPMTIACLLHNTLLAACRQNGLAETALPPLDL